MRINNNILSMNAHRSMGQVVNRQSKMMEKLSSGYRINRAGDDAAGLAISEKMRGQIRGLNQAARNAQDGISMIQTFEGALSESHSMLQRMRELSVQASNDTNVSVDREAIQKEMLQLTKEIDRIANNTEFNTLKMMNHGSASAAGAKASAIKQLNDKIPKWINDSMKAIHDRFGIDYPDSPTLRNMTIEYVDEPSAGYGARMETSNLGASLTMRINLDSFVQADGSLYSEDDLDRLVAHEVMHAFQYTEMKDLLLGTPALSNAETWFMEGLAMTVQGANDWIPNVPLSPSIGSPENAVVDLAGGFKNTKADYASAFVMVKTLHEITDGGISAIIDELEGGASLQAAIANTSQGDRGEVTAGLGNYTGATAFDDFIADFNANKYDPYLSTSTDFTLGTGVIVTGATPGTSGNLSKADTIVNGTGDALVKAHFNLDFKTGPTASGNTVDKVTLQIGANAGQTISISAFNATAEGLGVESVSVTSHDDANKSIATIDKGISEVSKIRSKLGAYQNRLEHSLKNLQNTSENLQSAESRVRDADMAKTMMDYTKSNILVQAAQSMMAQANQNPRGVLQLLN